MRLRTILLAILILGVSFAGATFGMQWLSPSQSADRPTLAEVPPLPSVSRTSTIIAPTSIALSAIREAMEREAPRNLAGKRDRDNPISQIISNAEIGWTASRSPLALDGRGDALVASTVINGTLRATGQISTQAASGIGNALTGFLGQDVGRSVERLAGRTLDQRADIRGNVMVSARPTITPAWRLEPNLAAQVSIGDANLSIAGIRLNIGNEVKPVLERSVNEQVSALQTRLRTDRFLEVAGRREWAKLCRSIPLGAASANLPNLWLEVRPMRAFAAQPRIEAAALVLTLGVEAQTRIVPTQTQPECPFPATLDLLPQAEPGRINLAVPIDVPFTEVKRLIAAQLAGRTLPADKTGGFDVTIRGAKLAASGDRLLISLDVQASKKSWFGLGGAATVHVWGRPVLDRSRQQVRLAEVTLDVASEATLVDAAARAARPYLEAALAEHAVIDLRPFAANARHSIEAAIAEFRLNGDGVRVDAAIADLRLVDIAFDATTLRVIAEADGTANVTVTSLPAR